MEVQFLSKTLVRTDFLETDSSAPNKSTSIFTSVTLDEQSPCTIQNLNRIV